MAAISDIVLQLTGIAKRFGALVANDRISLTLQRGKVLAVLDEYGADKSTLMPILFGDSQRFVRLPVLARECLCVACGAWLRSVVHQANVSLLFTSKG